MIISKNEILPMPKKKKVYRLMVVGGSKEVYLVISHISGQQHDHMQNC